MYISVILTNGYPLQRTDLPEDIRSRVSVVIPHRDGAHIWSLGDYSSKYMSDRIREFCTNIRSFAGENGYCVRITTKDYFLADRIESGLLKALNGGRLRQPEYRLELSELRRLLSDVSGNSQNYSTASA